jgi:RHS repeat-associated protein
LAGNPVGDLEYSYDADGRVIEKTGSLAKTNLPQPIVSNTFNLANEMTAFNGVLLTYDANGNLTSDGTNTYTWDARNHLVSLAGANAASFAYDPAGRRAQKTINGASTQFLNDGSNPVQEIQNGAPSANLLTGLGIDEYFSRTDSAGPRSFLADILGSTLALVDATGSFQTQYSYDPFGSTAATGQANSNVYQFAGRENDGTGLYFDRARYYSPVLQRFLSQDPIEFGGGDANLYSYAGNDPLSFIDSQGTDPTFGQQKDFDCDFLNNAICKAECLAQGKLLRNCSETREWQITKVKGNLLRLKWVFISRNCDCGGDTPPKCGNKSPAFGPLPVPVPGFP